MHTLPFIELTYPVKRNNFYDNPEKIIIFRLNKPFYII